jgi:hypothetical protein
LFLKGGGIDPHAADEEVPVEMVAGGEAGGADAADVLARFDCLAYFGNDFGEVVVAAVEAEAVVDDDGPTANVEAFGDDDGSGGGGVDRGAAVSAEINAFMVGGEGAAIVGTASAVEGGDFEVAFNGQLEGGCPLRGRGGLVPDGEESFSFLLDRFGVDFGRLAG